MKRLTLRMRFFAAVYFAASLTTACIPSAGQTNTLEARLSAEAQKLIETYELPGMTIAVAGEEGLRSVAVGLANLETARAMTPETPMLAASIGKTFVAATVLQLSAQRVLDLDAPISNWLATRAWFEHLPNSTSITIRHLLQHTSGLIDHVHMPAFAELGIERAAEQGPEGLIGLVLNTKPLFDAGAGWSYTDTGYLLLGLIIEEATGRCYEELVQAQLLTPLNLAGTGPSNQVDIDGLARGYVSPASGLGLPIHTTDDNDDMVWNPRVEWTGGGLYSVSQDLARWGRTYFSGRLLGKSLLAEMTKSAAVPGDDADAPYGLGLAMRTDDTWGPVYGHRGWIPGYVSSLQYYPEYDIAIAFQTNTDIGIIDASVPVVLEIETRLGTLVLDPTAFAE